MKKLIALTLALVLFFSTNALSFRTAAVNGYSVDTPYIYPVVPGTDAWAALETRVDMAEACMIPDELLSEMTTSALLETVLNYPLLADIMAYNSAEQGLERVAGSFNGLQELLERNDLQITLDNFSLEDSYIADEPKAYKMVIAGIVFTMLKTLTAYSSIVNVRTVIDYDYTPTAVMTPTADWVSAKRNMSWYDHGYSRSLTENEILVLVAAIDQAYIDEYGVARLDYPHNPSCNCHCFALYGEGALEPFWIDDPRYYYFGSAYFGVANGHPAPLREVGENDTIFPQYVLYYDLETTPTNSGYYVHTAIRLNQNYYYSKWGKFGVFSHSKTRNPYYNPYDEIANNQILTGVSYWRWDYEVIED